MAHLLCAPPRWCGDYPLVAGFALEDDTLSYSAETATATRAEVAAMLRRFVELVINTEPSEG